MSLNACNKNFIYKSLLVALVIIAPISIVGAAAIGYINIHPSDILAVVWAKAIGAEIPSHIANNIQYVIMDIRLPRILASFLVGVALAISGVVYQGILLNPLADPYTLGVSSGAALGAALALFANLFFLPLSLPICAFAGAILTLFAVIYLSSSSGQISSTNLILSGVIISAILSAGISFIKYLADEDVSAIVFWLMGSFVARGWSEVISLIICLIPGFAISIYYARDLNIMATGSRSSNSLGVNTTLVRYVLLITASLMSAVAVSCAGIIGFIGLIIPHLMRLAVGPDNRKLLPLSALSGGILLLSADTITRAILPVEVPIGILTALIGGPVFCIIFRKKQNRLRDD
ncbi:MAG: iron ABC transporter permease [Desulfotalea sp.]